MKVFISLALLLGFLVMGTLYITEEDHSLQRELSHIKHPDMQTLHELHEKFALLDIDAEGFDLNGSIKELEAARKLYPLDDELKMISIELNHKRAQLANEHTKAGLLNE